MELELTASGGASASSRVPHHSYENGVRRPNGIIQGQDFMNIGGDMSRRHQATCTAGSSTRNFSTAVDRESTSAAYVYRRGAEATQTKFCDTRTSPIVRLLFHTTLTQAKLDKEVIRRLDMDKILRKLTPEDDTFVRDVCEKFLEYVRNSKEVSLDSQVRGIESTGWDVTDNNIYVEFKKVVNETFDNGVTWGGVVGFLGFALGFSVFVYNRGMQRAVVSVAEWTKQVIEEDIGSFFLKNNGWEGFREVIEALLRRQKRIQRRIQADGGANNESPSFWQNAIAATTVAAGAAVLFGLRQAFS